MTKTLIAVLLLLVYQLSSAAGALTGTREVQLVNGKGDVLPIGKVSFKADGERVAYTLNLDTPRFSDEFLSMRPFRCISEAQVMICHLSYPYKKQGYITDTDLTDLEYDLLFLHKSATEYGINAWNGLYYLLSVSEQGLDGELQEVDLNVLAAPPEEGDLRPITKGMLYEADPSQHLFPTLRIR